MQTIEYRTIDKSAWGAGAWQGEPDKRQWQDEASGLPCLIVRGPVGAWCGYVGVPESHPWFGVGYSETVPIEKQPGGHIPEANTDVHGGLTFAGKCAGHSREQFVQWRARKPTIEREAANHPQGDAAEFLRTWARCFDDYDAWVERLRSTAICHLPAPGDSDDVWWFGFDCAHAGDLAPKMNSYGHSHDGDVYRDSAYVQAEVEKLAAQLAAAAAS